jgi:uncharacterized protein YoxC
MDMVNIALLLIAIAIIALVPIGCVMTRGRGPRGITTPVH